MAFYYTQGDYAERLESNIKDKQITPGIKDELSQATEAPVHSNNNVRREKGPLRIPKGQRKENRITKILNDIGESKTERWRSLKNSLSETLITKEVLLNSEGRVSYGTWHGIICYLTQVDKPPDNCKRSFYMTFRSFSTPKDLAEALINRARELPRTKSLAPQIQSWYERIRATILHNIFLSIKSWYENYWLPIDDDIVLNSLCSFLAIEYLPKCQGSMAKECYKLLHEIEIKHDNINIRALVKAASTKSLHTTNHRHGINADTRRMDSTSIRSSYIHSVRDAPQHDNTLYSNSRADASNRAVDNNDEDTDIYNDNGHHHIPHHRDDERHHHHKHHHRGILHRIFSRHSHYHSSNDSGSSILASSQDSDTESDMSFGQGTDEVHDNDSANLSFLGHGLKTQLDEAQKPSQRPTQNVNSGNELVEGSRTHQIGSDVGRNDEGPDISDLLMATVGVDLSLNAYRRMSHIYQVTPADVACQLTIIESSCYCQIQPYELLNKEFSRGSDSRATNVRQMSRWCTQITRWASVMILSETTPERRCRLLKYFIELGIQLLALKNYDAVMAIKAAIYSAAVMRLKRTWSLLPNKYSIMCTRIHEAMNPGHNYANYRSMLRRSQPPLLPFLGLYLTDLTFLEDGNPTYRRFEQPDELVARENKSQTDPKTNTYTTAGHIGNVDEPNNPKPSVQLIGQTCALFARRKDVDLNSSSILINFEKCNRVVDIINEMQKFQVEYSGNFTMAIPGLQQYLIEQWERCDAEGYDDDKIYSMSLQCEPRAPQLAETRPQPIPAATRLSRLIPGSQRLRNKENAASSSSNSPI